MMDGQKNIKFQSGIYSSYQLVPILSYVNLVHVLRLIFVDQF